MAETSILFVDDEEAILRSLTDVLEEWARERRVELCACRSGAEALELLEKKHHSIAIVVSDQHMPGMRGTELFSQVRGRWPDIITILHSGHAEIPDLVRAVQGGIFSFLVKPISSSYLQQELDKALQVRRLREENRRFLAMIQEELRWAGELQQALFKLDIPEPSWARFAVTYLPLAEFRCSGDYYDVIPLGGERYLFMIGDVAGHGVTAAFMTFYLRAAVRTGYIGSVTSVTPEGLLTWLNARMCSELASLPSLLVTFIACLLDPDTSTLTYSSAGHLPLYLIHGDIVEALRTAGPGIGFSPESAYRLGNREIAPGDRIVLLTDGLRELGPGTTIDEGSFAGMLCRNSGKPDFNAAVLDEIRSLAGPGGFHDDATLLTATIGSPDKLPEDTLAAELPLDK